MLSSLFSYAASRVAGDAVDGIARRAVWGSLAALLLLTGFFFALLIAFWVFEPEYGAIRVAAVIVAICVAGALSALAVPAILEWRKRRMTQTARSADPMVQTVAAVKDETEAAVDYFGAIQVVASAFMLGLGAARQLRTR
jgi:hypothetical protein